jgi:hypothetical protein
MQRQWKKTRHLFQKIAKYTGKARTKEAIKLQVVDKWLEDHYEILNEIVAHNKVHFSQAKGCALSNRSFQQVTDHNSLPDLNNLPELERKFIQEINSFQTTTTQDEIDFEVWRHKFKTWRETTWTSTSRLYLGHFKSLVVIPHQWDHDHCKRDNQMESYQQELLESTLCIVNFSIQSGTILDLWINATNIMIPKKNRSYQVTDYRNIHIYECDMNAMLSLKWKEALKQSEDQNVICPSQVGGRKQRSSQFPIHIKISQLEISMLTQKDYGQINYDAKACYDRILPNIAAMPSWVHGVSNKIVNLHNNLLLQMR